MKNLLIIGARGTGRELYGFREDFIGYNETFIIHSQNYTYSPIIIILMNI